ncbi:MAG: HepT-like ribonuclease domain-containing protein, partial [Tumebacillaceae bacterium]
MFITDQHRTQIRGYLSEMEKQFDVLTALKPHSLEDFQTQPILRAAGERALHLVLECLTDIGNIIIDALIMR